MLINNVHSGTESPETMPATGPAAGEGARPTGAVATESGNPECREGVRSSFGPKTDAGKARSSRNAVTHGLRAEYEKLRQQYLDEYKPNGAIESTLVDMIIFAAWQLYKIREMELFTDIDLGAPGSFGRSEKLARYRGSHERLLFRSLNQLKQIQQERVLLTADKSAALPAHIPPAVRLTPLFSHLKSLSKHPKTLSASTHLLASVPKPSSSTQARPRLVAKSTRRRE